MNRVFKLKFNRRHQSLVVTSELATSAVAKTDKSFAKKALAALAVAAASFGVVATAAGQLDQIPQIQKIAKEAVKLDKNAVPVLAELPPTIKPETPNGQVITTVPGNQGGFIYTVPADAATKTSEFDVKITATDKRPYATWQSFNVGKNVNVKHDAKDGVKPEFFYHKVESNNVTKIFGTVQSEYPLVVYSPSGVYVGQNGIVAAPKVVISTQFVQQENLKPDLSNVHSEIAKSKLKGKASFVEVNGTVAAQDKVIISSDAIKVYGKVKAYKAGSSVDLVAGKVKGDNVAQAQYQGSGHYKRPEFSVRTDDKGILDQDSGLVVIGGEVSADKEVNVLANIIINGATPADSVSQATDFNQAGEYAANAALEAGLAEPNIRSNEVTPGAKPQNRNPSPVAEDKGQVRSYHLLANKASDDSIRTVAKDQRNTLTPGVKANGKVNFLARQAILNNGVVDAESIDALLFQNADSTPVSLNQVANFGKASQVLFGKTLNIGTLGQKLEQVDVNFEKGSKVEVIALEGDVNKPAKGVVANVRAKSLKLNGEFGKTNKRTVAKSAVASSGLSHKTATTAAELQDNINLADFDGKEGLFAEALSTVGDKKIAQQFGKAQDSYNANASFNFSFTNLNELQDETKPAKDYFDTATTGLAFGKATNVKFSVNNNVTVTDGKNVSNTGNNKANTFVSAELASYLASRGNFDVTAEKFARDGQKTRGSIEFNDANVVVQAGQQVTASQTARKEGYLAADKFTTRFVGNDITVKNSTVNLFDTSAVAKQEDYDKLKNPVAQDGKVKLDFALSAIGYDQTNQPELGNLSIFNSDLAAHSTRYKAYNDIVVKNSFNYSSDLDRQELPNVDAQLIAAATANNEQAYQAALDNAPQAQLEPNKLWNPEQDGKFNFAAGNDVVVENSGLQGNFVGVAGNDLSLTGVALAHTTLEAIATRDVTVSDVAGSTKRNFALKAQTGDTLVDNLDLQLANSNVEVSAGHSTLADKVKLRGTADSVVFESGLNGDQVNDVTDVSNLDANLYAADLQKNGQLQQTHYVEGKKYDATPVAADKRPTRVTFAGSSTRLNNAQVVGQVDVAVAGTVDTALVKNTTVAAFADGADFKDSGVAPANVTDKSTIADVTDITAHFAKAPAAVQAKAQAALATTQDHVTKPEAPEAGKFVAGSSFSLDAPHAALVNSQIGTAKVNLTPNAPTAEGVENFGHVAVFGGLTYTNELTLRGAYYQDATPEQITKKLTDTQAQARNGQVLGKDAAVVAGSVEYRAHADGQAKTFAQSIPYVLEVQGAFAAVNYDVGTSRNFKVRGGFVDTNNVAAQQAERDADLKSASVKHTVLPKTEADFANPESFDNKGTLTLNKDHELKNDRGETVATLLSGLPQDDSQLRLVGKQKQEGFLRTQDQTAGAAKYETSLEAAHYELGVQQPRAEVVKYVEIHSEDGQFKERVTVEEFAKRDQSQYEEQGNLNLLLLKIKLIVHASTPT